MRNERRATEQQAYDNLPDNYPESLLCSGRPLRRCSQETKLTTWLDGEVVEASNLQKRIAEHHEVLAALSKRVDQVLVGVEALTLEARDALAEYQEKKRQTGKALSAASRKFLLAQRAFGKVDDLLVDVTDLENTHIALSHSVNDLMARNNSAEVRRILRDFMKTRRAFRAAYRQIERCRKEARMAEKVNKNGPND